MPLETFPYQEVGSDYIAQRERCGLHDEMGVGKTAQVIRAANKIGATRGIVICPAGLRENWLGEFRKFSHVTYRITGGRSIHDFIAWQRGRFNILVTSYEQATKWAASVYNAGEPIDFVAMDEAHYIKNTETARTKAILGPKADGDNGAIAWADHVWHVTGTPMANDPIDCYTFLRMCRATDLGRDAFVRRYFYSHASMWGSRQEVRPEMLGELQYVLDNNRLRRTKKDVGLQLPPIFLTTSLVDGDTEPVRNMLASYPGLEQAIVTAVEQGGLSFLDAQHVSTLRRLVGEAKAVPYAHMLLEELSVTSDKRVVYGYHREALRTLRDFLVRKGVHAVLVEGGIPDSVRQQYIEMFQSDPSVRVFIGNIRAAGTGLTLTAACEIDMFESDWTPAGNAQAIMRVHRIGQTRAVRARFITLAKSLDEVVNRIVAEKTRAIAQIEGNAMAAAPLDLPPSLT